MPLSVVTMVMTLGTSVRWGEGLMAPADGSCSGGVWASGAQREWAFCPHRCTRSSLHRPVAAWAAGSPAPAQPWSGGAPCRPLLATWGHPLRPSSGSLPPTFSRGPAVSCLFLYSHADLDRSFPLFRPSFPDFQSCSLLFGLEDVALSVLLSPSVMSSPTRVVG